MTMMYMTVMFMTMLTGFVYVFLNGMLAATFMRI